MRLHALGLRLILIFSLSAGLAFAARSGPSKHAARLNAVTVSHPSDRTASMKRRLPNPSETMARFANELDALAIAVATAQYEAEQAAIREAEEAARAAEAERVENERREAAARAAASRPARPTASEAVAAPAGACTGFAIPDYIIQRESGGNPNTMNPSGAYGCAQTLLSHYSGGTCAGLDPYTIEGQRECVWRLSNGGTNLAPWAQTR